MSRKKINFYVEFDKKNIFVNICFSLILSRVFWLIMEGILGVRLETLYLKIESINLKVSKLTPSNQRHWEDKYLVGIEPDPQNEYFKLFPSPLATEALLSHIQLRLLMLQYPRFHFAPTLQTSSFCFILSKLNKAENYLLKITILCGLWCRPISNSFNK